MMAYNYPYYYPQVYNQNYQQNQQIQNSGFVSVRSVEEALNYPVAPGNSITFKDENQPFVYTKTKGFSPLEQPTFERYRLVKVEEPQSVPKSPTEAFDVRSEIKSLWDELNGLKAQITKGEGNDKSANDKPVPSIYEQSESVSPANEHSC